MTDNMNITKVLCGAMELSDKEKSELITELQEYLKADVLDQSSKKRLIQSKMEAHAKDGDPCPCCGN